MADSLKAGTDASPAQEDSFPLPEACTAFPLGASCKSDGDTFGSEIFLIEDLLEWHPILYMIRQELDQPETKANFVA
jgi:hypothetical protein